MYKCFDPKWTALTLAGETVCVEAVVCGAGAVMGLVVHMVCRVSQAQV